MNQQISKIIDTSGKCLLFWYLYQTYKYLFSGNFRDQINSVSNLFQFDFTFLGAYSVVQIPVSTIGVFIAIPLLLKGNIWGLLVGSVYWVMGNLINPFWFVISYEKQILATGNVTTLLTYANYIWAGISLVTIVSFYFHRRYILSQVEK